MVEIYIIELFSLSSSRIDNINIISLLLPSSRTLLVKLVAGGSLLLSLWHGILGLEVLAASIHRTQLLR